MPFAAVILLTGQGSIDTAVAAMKEGAYDFLTKPVEVSRLKLLIPKAAEKSEALREVALLRRRVKQLWGLGRLVGTSPAMQAVHRLIELAAPTPAAVLITGESGTGKELVARTLHELSPRGRGPFVAVNCAAIPETLLESEIFGHEKGAFTGALERRQGCFELAHEGTIFLDEIAEMSVALQAKFLRILEDSMVRRLGAKTEIKVDVRVLAATNKDPEQAMKAGTFREDLFYRLNVVSLAMPPLRDRREDVPLLIAGLSRGVQRQVRQAHHLGGRGGPRDPDGAGLARQRARAAQLHGARDHRVRRQPDRTGAPAVEPDDPPGAAARRGRRRPWPSPWGRTSRRPSACSSSRRSPPPATTRRRRPIRSASASRRCTTSCAATRAAPTARPPRIRSDAAGGMRMSIRVKEMVVVTLLTLLVVAHHHLDPPVAPVPGGGAGVAAASAS